MKKFKKNVIVDKEAAERLEKAMLSFKEANIACMAMVNKAILSFKEFALAFNNMNKTETNATR